MTRTAIQTTIRGRSLGFSVAGALVLNLADNGQVVIDGSGLTYTNPAGVTSIISTGSTVSLGEIPRLYAPASRILVFADSIGGIITSTSAGTTIYTLPSMSMFGSSYTRDAANPVELIFMFQRGGLGALFVTPNQYLGAVTNATAMTSTGSVPSGVPSSTIVGDWVARTDLGGTMYQLIALPYTTAANWVARTGTMAPTASGITINWNNLDPSTLAQDHPPVMLISKGVDSWVAC